MTNGRKLIQIFIGHLSGLFLILASASSGAEALYSWIQYVPDGMEARVITNEGTCPVVLADGQKLQMSQRSNPGEQYPIFVCALLLQKVTGQIEIEGKILPLAKSLPQRILIIGDTGCRLKVDRFQACNDPVEWPFRTGAAFVANLKPDLILHVGDFHYRETPCPEGNTGCAGSPYGDSWAVWEADFFAPLGHLLTAAPWVFVRGNHEECERGGRGWARILDPYAWSSDTGCIGPGEPYLVDLGGIKLAVIDVSTADEEKANTEQAARFKSEYASVAKSASGSPVWIAQHRPIWALEETKPQFLGDNKTLALAARSGLSDNIQTILSGHHHVLEVITYDENYPVQTLSGNGGDTLATGVPETSDGFVINGVKVKKGIAKSGVFGYSLLERADKAPTSPWVFSGFDYQGNLLLKCTLKNRDAICGQ